MALTHIDITSRKLYEDGATFGETGQYERIDGRAHFAVDPTHPANAAITDLDLAARGSDELVHFVADIMILQPVEAGRANGNLLLHVPNRGRVPSVPFCTAAPPLTVSERVAPGDGFLLRQGWTVAWCGWQWDVIRRPAYVGLEAPLALDRNGRPLGGEVAVEFEPSVPHSHQRLAHWPLTPPPGNPDFQHRTYPAADLADPEAVLTARTSRYGERAVIERELWQFARDEGGEAIPDPEHVLLEGGFLPGSIYELRYRTDICPVAGTGLLALRDAVSFLRSDGSAGNPAAGRIRHTFGFGVSQCGRLLRDFLYHGLNTNEAGEAAFDGLIPFVAGARRGEFNLRFAQPSVQHRPSSAHTPPFAPIPVTGTGALGKAGLLDRQRDAGNVPRIFEINSSSEYWRSEASLIHTDLDAAMDVEPPAEERIYMFAGTQHGSGFAVLSRETVYGVMTANYLCTVDYNAPLRAALVNLADWVVDGREPPPGIVPRIADGTAVPRDLVLKRFEAFPATLLAAGKLPQLRRPVTGDPPETSAGEDTFPCLVPAVDADGNELAGVRTPALTVPLGTHTGWNPHARGSGKDGELVDMLGSTIPFAPDEESRRKQGDPRPSIAERYTDKDEFLSKVRAEAEALAGQRLILQEDVDYEVGGAARRWDLVTKR